MRESASVDPFGRVDESPNEVFELLTPSCGELICWLVSGAGVEDFLAADFVGDGVEVIVPGDVARWAGFLF